MPKHLGRGKLHGDSPFNKDGTFNATAAKKLVDGALGWPAAAAAGRLPSLLPPLPAPAPAYCTRRRRSPAFARPRRRAPPPATPQPVFTVPRSRSRAGQFWLKRKKDGSEGDWYDSKPARKVFAQACLGKSEPRTANVRHMCLSPAEAAYVEMAVSRGLRCQPWL